MRKTTLLILMLFCLFLTGCNTTETPDNKYNDYLEELVIDSEFSKDFILPETINDLDITWESSKPDVLSPQGYSYIQESDTTVKLVAKITVDGKDYAKEFEVLVKADTEGLFDIAWEYYAPKLDSQTAKNIKLFSGKYGQFSVVYKSLNEDVITSDGQVIQRSVDQTATFEITIIKGNERKVFYKDIKVLKFTDVQCGNMVLEWANEQVRLFKEGLISELPHTHPEYGTTITWSSDIPGTISPEGVLIRPVEVADCKFTYEIISGDYVTKNYFIYEDFGGATEQEFLDAWLPTIMPKNIVAHKYTTKWDGRYDVYASHRTVNTGAVLNLLNGKELEIKKDYYIDVEGGDYASRHWSVGPHPEISTDPKSESLQEVYEHFYEGYTIPNEENILWIVVHESGMPDVGNDSELLASIQRRNADDAKNNAQSSWHYQVDENAIYQSFDDNVQCWHAGGGNSRKLPYRNSNSIGIEMCINQDGNYDGSMAHDAKLVASLMHKYNLTLDNVVRHYDTSGKDCPSYMIQSDRYTEFLQKVVTEYIAMEYLKDAEVTWTISHPELFEKGPNGLYYTKKVDKATEVTITLKVVKGTYIFNGTSTVIVKPDGGINA